MSCREWHGCPDFYAYRANSPTSRRQQKPEPDPEPDTEPDSEPEPEPDPEPEHETEEDSSDCILLTSESADNDEITIDQTLSTYPNAVPITDNTKINKGSEIQWFANWIAQINDDVDDLVQTDSNNESVLRNQQDVDTHARKAPVSLNGSFEELIGYLTNHLEHLDRPEVFRARALIVWLSNQDVDSPSVKRRTGHRESPEGYITLLAQKRCTYSTFYTVLCRKANIQCAQITGICKASNYQPGDRDVDKTVWNAIYVEGTWQIVQPYWVCRCLVGHRIGGWIKLEADGKSIGRRQEEASGIIENAFQEYYFMTNPAEFLYACHPDSPQWQLCRNPISRECFIEKAYFLPPFFGLGLIIETTDSCVYRSENGEIKIVLSAPAKNANAIDLWYDILLKEGIADQDMESKFLLSPENIPRIVAMLRCGERWKIRVNFPTEGTYKLRLYGRANKSDFLCLAEFRLDCKRKKNDFVPLPIDPRSVGFGPGSEAERAGLLFPSHRDGLYPIEKDKDLQISFRMLEEVVESIDVRATLFATTIVDGQTVEQEFSQSVNCEVRRRRREIRITATVAENGEFALFIEAGSLNSERSYKNICNYLLSTSENRPRENNFMRLAKTNLRQLLDVDPKTRYEMTEAVNDIDSAITKCLKVKVDADDEEIESAKIRMEYLQARIEIHDTKLRENWHVTEKTIRRLKQSRFAVIFQRSIEELIKIRERQGQERAQELERRERNH